MTDQERRYIGETFLHGLRERDASLLKSIMADDVVWSLPGESLMSGEATGVDAILKRAAILAGFGVTIELEQVLFGLHDVALLLHNTGAGRFDGRVLDEHLTTVIHLDGGKIRRLDTFISDVGMLNEFFTESRRSDYASEIPPTRSPVEKQL